MRASLALVSGVRLAPKSSASNTCRISTSSPPPNGARLSHSIASSRDLHCHSQKPAISSLVSANGPSMTVLLLPGPNFTRTPFEDACSPSPASMTPAFTSSSLNFVMAVRLFSSGRTPASDSLFAFTITMNRISVSPLVFRGAAAAFRDSLLWRPSLSKRRTTTGKIDIGVDSVEDADNLLWDSYLEFGRVMDGPVRCADEQLNGGEVPTATERGEVS